MPLNLFLTKGNITEKSRGLGVIARFEENVNFLKRVSFEISAFPPTNTLAEFMQRQILSELDQIGPSEEIVEAVKTGITDVDNVLMKLYYLGCMSYRETENNLIADRKVFWLIPGVCVTVKAKLLKCYQLYYNTPENHNCIVLYENENCDDKQKFYISFLLIWLLHENL